MAEHIQQCRPFNPALLEVCDEYQTKLYLAYGANGSQVVQTAKSLGKDPSNVSKSIQIIQRKGKEKSIELEWAEDVGEIVEKPLRVLLFDIETRPHEAYVWDFWNQNISHDQIKDYGHPISFAAKWLGSDDIVYEEARTKSNKPGSDKQLTRKLMRLLDQADVVVAHNGKAFDVKKMKARALKHGIQPPSPYKICDTFLIAKREFKLDRNSLEYIAEFLECTPKLKDRRYPGFSLWKECMNGNPDAWEEMREYNIQDIGTLEEVYLKMRPWITTHPNLAMFYESDVIMCPKCSSTQLKIIKPINTDTQKYKGYRCENCGGIARGRATIATPEKRKSVLRNAV